jgi:aspartyl-tRNA(Asn)/glutamyl-tRNA(Gln) amidotransferase subunit C
MKLTREQVLHVAKLARLGLSEKEVEKFQKELSGILDYVEMLNEVQTDGVEPMSQVTGLENVTRDDSVLDKWDPKRLLDCSPLPIERGQIKVKPVLDNK